jgi:hypothetical protein
VWRQWTVGDVVQILNGDAKPSSVLVENPPELAWYDVCGVDVLISITNRACWCKCVNSK